MGYEILGSRILAPYFGSAVFTWGALISVVMLGLSIGYYIGGKFADKRKSFRDLVYVFFLACIFIFPVSFIGKNICLHLSRINIDIRYTALAASLILFLIPCILLGIVLPYLVTIFAGSKHKIGNAVGSIYATSTLGGILGVIFISFCLIGLVGTASAIKLICIPLLSCGLLSLLLLLKNPQT